MCPHFLGRFLSFGNIGSKPLRNFQHLFNWCQIITLVARWQMHWFGRKWTFDFLLRIGPEQTSPRLLSGTKHQVHFSSFRACNHLHQTILTLCLFLLNCTAIHCFSVRSPGAFLSTFKLIWQSSGCWSQLWRWAALQSSGLKHWWPPGSCPEGSRAFPLGQNVLGHFPEVDRQTDEESLERKLIKSWSLCKLHNLSSPHLNSYGPVYCVKCINRGRIPAGVSNPQELVAIGDEKADHCQCWAFCKAQYVPPGGEIFVGFNLIVNLVKILLA